LAPDRGRIKKRPADENEMRSERQGLQHVRATANAAIHHQGKAGVIGDNLWKNVERCNGMIELPAAVIRDDHTVGTRLACPFDVWGCQQSFDDELAPPTAADML